MKYNFNNKKIDNKIDLGRYEWEVFEELIKHDGQPVTAKALADVICEKYYYSDKVSRVPTENSLRGIICRMNKKLDGLIKCKRGFGYYILEDIKIM